VLEVAGREVTISNPGKVYFPRSGITKLDLVRYYLDVGEGAVRGVFDRPMALKRSPNGVEGEFFFQKRAPAKPPPWVKTVTLAFPSGRTADEIVVTDVAQLAWIINLGCIDLNPHPVRAGDLEHPDELRVDLDPGPGVGFERVREAAGVVREALAELGLVGWPKTSGSRGIHIYVRLEPRWGFDDVRRAALALARDAARRAPALITSKWWKEERHGVFVDYNQNAKDRTVASAYSVRPTPDGRVSAPLTWDEVPVCDLGDFTLKTMPARFAKLGDLMAGIDRSAAPLDSLLELAARHEAEGLGDAPCRAFSRRSDGRRRSSRSRRRRRRRTRSRASRGGANATRKRPPTSVKQRCSSTPCAAVTRRGPAFA